jgi:hypothetical protein
MHTQETARQCLTNHASYAGMPCPWPNRSCEGLRQSFCQMQVLAGGDLRIVCPLAPRAPRPLAGTPTRSQSRRRASQLGPRGQPWRQRWPRALPKPAVRYGAVGESIWAREWVAGSPDYLLWTL